MALCTSFSNFSNLSISNSIEIAYSGSSQAPEYTWIELQQSFDNDRIDRSKLKLRCWKCFKVWLLGNWATNIRSHFSSRQQTMDIGQPLCTSKVNHFQSGKKLYAAF